MGSQLSDKQLKIVKIYSVLARKLGRNPTRDDLLKKNVSRDAYRNQFGNLEGLKEAARSHNPEAFKDIIDETRFNDAVLTSLMKKVKTHKKFFVTTAVVGCKVHKGFLESIDAYCEAHNAVLLVLPSADPASEAGWELDPALIERDVVFSDLALNKSVFVSSIKLSAKHIDPITGLQRLGQRHGSFLYASPKQRLKMTSTSNTKTPHAVMTTGAVTLPNYLTTKYMSDRTAYIAHNDHIMGGIIVEVVSDKLFHYRQVQADSKGAFIDLGIQYSGSETKAVRPEALVLGDWHAGETSQYAREAFVSSSSSVVSLLKPKRIILHDFFDGKSISHHNAKNTVIRAIHANQNLLSLKAELEVLVRDLNEFTKIAEEIVIVKSNHDEVLDRYLSEARYVNDAQNHSLGLRLAAAMIDGHNPLKFALESMGLDNPEKVRWLDRDEDFKVSGVELGAHGDKGANGSRGSLRSMENAYGSSISGHAHTPEILRNAWQVGTCSLLKLDYNKGPSSWMNTSALLYSNGSKQLINVIEGDWKAFK